MRGSGLECGRGAPYVGGGYPRTAAAGAAGRSAHPSQAERVSTNGNSKPIWYADRNQSVKQSCTALCGTRAATRHWIIPDSSAPGGDTHALPEATHALVWAERLGHD